MAATSSGIGQKFAVIGLGSFGYSLAVRLSELGAEVMAFDREEKMTNEIKDRVALAVAMDCTDASLLEAQGINNVDLAIVAIGEDFGANVLTTRILKDMGLTVHSRATTEREERILRNIGADLVYRPEHAEGERIAVTLIRRESFDNYIPLSAGIDFVQVKPRGSHLGRTIADLDVRRVYGVNIAYIGRLTAEGRRIYRIPTPEDELQASDQLFLFGKLEDIERFLSASDQA
ncbi:TrkA family potassium uptake protein [Candidatus Fermentibacterales bacterium]|nr:TrkA family potassium uptake protein [Candidatus Fermentibacterales bacterium]